MVRSRWFFPAFHAFLFAVMWLIAFVQAQPLLDGPARWGFCVLFFADLPISIIGFSLMWDNKWNFGLLLWGIVGTAWWYILGVGIQRLLREAGGQDAPQPARINPDVFTASFRGQSEGDADGHSWRRLRREFRGSRVEMSVLPTIQTEQHRHVWRQGTTTLNLAAPPHTPLGRR
jgi:hypothetical protein